jgi:hypothetical protein
VSLRFLQGLVGLVFSHIGNRLIQCEQCLMLALEPFLRALSLEDLKIDAEFYPRDHVIGNMCFPICFMVDCCFTFICTPFDEWIQEVYYTKYKRLHALKLSRVCASGRKWIHEVTPFIGRTSDLVAWKRQRFSNLIGKNTPFRRLGDKGYVVISENRIVSEARDPL